MMDEILISAKDVAVMVGLVERTVWRLMNCGKLPMAMKVGGAKRWQWADFLQWIGDCPDANKDHPNCHTCYDGVQQVLKMQCPVCRSNDGFWIERENVVFGACHKHRVKWALDGRKTNDALELSLLRGTRDAVAEYDTVEPAYSREHYNALEYLKTGTITR